MRKHSLKISNQPTARSKKSTATVADDHLLRLAFTNTAQANIITIVSNGKIKVANPAACKLLGYSRKELLTKVRASIFNIKDSSFKKMLRERTTEGHSRAMVTAIKKNGKIFSCEITSAIFVDEEGIENSITTLLDMSQHILAQKNIDSVNEKLVNDNITLAKSKQKKIDTKNKKIVDDNIITALKKSNTRLEEHTEWIKNIAKSSYDVMWDWDIATGQIYVGESIREVFGYDVKNDIMVFDAFCKCLVEIEKEPVLESLKEALSSGAKSWNNNFMFKRRDGSVASTICRATIVRNDAGRATRLIGALQDVSELHTLEKKLADQVTIQKAQGEKFLLAAKLSFDVIWDWDLVTNEVFIGEGFEELFGYVIKENKGNMIDDWANYMHPDDKKKIEKELFDSIKSTAMEWEHAYRMIRADGSIAKVYARASIVRDKAGKAYRMIGAIQDLSRQKELEEELDHEIKLKEKQITEATEDAKEMERSNIGKELHDNINQLLGASRMYMEMAKRGGTNSAMYLGRSSEYTLTAIEEIRKLTKGLTTDIINDLGLCIAIENLSDDMAEVNAIKISCALQEFNEKSVSNKFKLNMFRIIQEQLNNIFKHARATSIIIQLSQNKKAVRLNITDNGIGFDTAAKQNGIGIENIKSRALAYDGAANFVSQPGSGCSLTVTFPVAA